MAEVQVIFAFIMVLVILMGTFCAMKMDESYKIHVRYAVLVPFISASGYLWTMVADFYVAYPADIIGALSILIMYWVIASNFTKYPMLDRRAKRDKIINKEDK